MKGRRIINDLCNKNRVIKKLKYFEFFRPEIDGDVSNKEKDHVITSHLESKQCFLI